MRHIARFTQGLVVSGSILVGASIPAYGGDLYSYSLDDGDKLPVTCHKVEGCTAEALAFCKRAIPARDVEIVEIDVQGVSFGRRVESVTCRVMSPGATPTG